MHSLADWKTRFPRIRQRADFWCIPASIENMLQYSGFKGLTQEDLILGYCRKYGQDGLTRIIPGDPARFLRISTLGMSDKDVMQLAKQCAFTHGNFETFAEPARQNAAFQKARLSLDFKGSLRTTDYFAAVTEAVKANCPVLISVKSGNQMFHIQSVVEVEVDKFKAYDPALDRVEDFNLANCSFSDDVLVLKRLP
jgi:hypothetical protein